MFNTCTAGKITQTNCVIFWCIRMYARLVSSLANYLRDKRFVVRCHGIDMHFELNQEKIAINCPFLYHSGKINIKIRNFSLSLSFRSIGWVGHGVGWIHAVLTVHLQTVVSFSSP